MRYWAAVDTIWDNAVPLSAILLGVLVLVGLIVLAVAGLRLWRVIKRTKGRLGEAGAALAAEGDRLQASLDRLPDRQAELQAALESLQRRAAVLSTLTSAAGQAAEILRSPLRFVGR